MKLLTEELKAKIPPLYANENKGDEAEVVAKFFTPWSNWTWYVTEASAQVRVGDNIDYKRLSDVTPDDDVVDVIFFGLVEGLEKELGYFSLSELTSVIGIGGLKIERDIHWNPKPLRELM